MMRYLAVIGITLFCFFQIGLAVDGQLDTSFDTDGIATTAFGTSTDEAWGVALQSDGKIVATGFTLGSTYDFAVARYNSNGSTDNSFSSDGKVTTAIGTGTDQAYSVAIQSDGKIVVAGYSNNGSNNDFAVVRYNTDGSLDTGFGATGIVTTAIGSSTDEAYSVAIQSDGKIVVAGFSNNGSNNDFAIVRYNSDGSLDDSFSADGIATTAIGSSSDNGRSVVIQSDGKIVVAGESYNGSNYDFAAVRYTSDGSLDNSFSADGKVTTALGSGDDRACSVAIQSDGKIVITGDSYSGSYSDFAVIRYNSDGSLDTGFDSDGKVMTDWVSYDHGYSIACQADGKIIVGGAILWSDYRDFAILRYNSDGSLDANFNSTGKVNIDAALSSRWDYGYSCAIQSDGNLIVAGTASIDGSGYDFAVIRVLNTISTVSFTSGSSYSPTVMQGQSNAPIGRFQLTASTSGMSLTAADITLNGLRSGMSNIKLWSSTDASFDSGSDTQLGSTVSSDPGNGSAASFSSFSSSISTDGTYYFVTADFSSASSGDIQGVLVSTDDLTISGGTVTSSISNSPLSSASLSIMTPPGSGYALNFDGDGDYITLDGTFMNNSMSVEAWVYSADWTPSGPQTIIGNTQWGGWAIALDGTDLTAWLYYTDTRVYTRSFNAANLSDWNHIAFTADGSYFQLYINGVVKVSEETGSTFYNPSYGVTQTLIGAEIGSDNSIEGDYFSGRIDEVRIWNDVRTESELQTYMCQRLTGSEDNLVAYYRMDEGSGMTIDNLQGNSSFDGAITNATWTTSGAAIGDAASYDYSSDGGYTVNLASSSNDDITATTTDGTVSGIQIYRVDSASNVGTPPSGWSNISDSHYFGVFPIGTDVQYIVTYNYEGHPGIGDENDLRLAYRSGNAAASWTDLSATLDAGVNTLTKTGQTGTEYILGSTTGDNSLPVELTTFTTECWSNGVMLKWSTESETENLGFLLERRTVGANHDLPSEWSQIASYITADALAGHGSTSEAHEYAYNDAAVVPGAIYLYRLADVDYSGKVTYHKEVEVKVEVEDAQTPLVFGLKRAYPNPFNPSVTIPYGLTEDGNMTLKVYNLRGQLVETLISTYSLKGTYSLNWQPVNLSAGIYIVRMQSGNHTAMQKVVFVK